MCYFVDRFCWQENKKEDELCAEKNTELTAYYLTAIDSRGRAMSSANDDGSGWRCGKDKLDPISFVDRQYLFYALSEAPGMNFQNVKVRRVRIILGDELSDEEIGVLRREEDAAIQQREREHLIEEKGLSPEQVALIRL